ncbi:hypothetical protein [Egicoccus sp. AB-alg2]|uniref:hypothetical protein n=1 Tax=Egicoccus sp. AB-alg2 TaxID=3242693 RepID=UPI00359EC5B5
MIPVADARPSALASEAAESLPIRRLREEEAFVDGAVIGFYIGKDRARRNLEADAKHHAATGADDDAAWHCADAEDDTCDGGDASHDDSRPVMWAANVELQTHASDLDGWASGDVGFGDVDDFTDDGGANDDW